MTAKCNVYFLIEPRLGEGAQRTLGNGGNLNMNYVLDNKITQC